MQKLYTLFIAAFLFFSAKAQISQVQFINNSADSLMQFVKVTMNGDLKKDSLGFRKATSFLSVAGDSTYTVVFQSNLNAAKSASVSQTLLAGKKYVFVLNGVTNDTSFVKNPDSVSILLNIVVIDQSVAAVPASNQTTLFFVNGSTDAPTFDLYARDSANTLVLDNDSLNKTGEVTLPDTLVDLKLKTADGAFNISTFLFSLSGLGGQITTALTSGFLAPGSNNKGPNFSVYVVDSSGNVISAINVSLVNNRNNLVDKILLYPNPVSDIIHINYNLSQSATLQYSIFDLSGTQVMSNTLGLVRKGNNEQQVMLHDLPAGLYFFQLQSDFSAKTVSFIVK
ncbi:MAG: hypothetical protein JWN78_635 [Bacteroidota bacterium]|nr:hypothetical protein [Bacteroidota bacterium]